MIGFLKKMAVFLALSGVVAVGASNARAADDFGPRFTQDSPTALQDNPAAPDQEALDEAARMLQDIAPAAGESEITPESGAPLASPDTLTTPQDAPPAAP